MVSICEAFSSFSFGGALGAGEGFVLGFLVVLLFMDGNRDPIGFPPELVLGSFGFFRDATPGACFSSTYCSAKPSTVLTLALLLEIESQDGSEKSRVLIASDKVIDAVQKRQVPTRMSIHGLNGRQQRPVAKHATYAAERPSPLLVHSRKSKQSSFHQGLGQRFVSIPLARPGRHLAWTSFYEYFQVSVAHEKHQRTLARKSGAVIGRVSSQLEILSNVW